MSVPHVPGGMETPSPAKRSSPLLSFDGTQSTSSVSSRKGRTGANTDEMVRRLSEISTSSISFDTTKLAMYKNFSGRSSYARSLDGEAVGFRLPRRCRTTGYPASRSPAIAEADFLEELQEFSENFKREQEAKKKVISLDNTRRSKTTVVSL